jgi:Mor family transcriptional regulator
VKPADKIPQLIKDWSEKIARRLVDDAGLSRNESADLGSKIALDLTEEHAGSQLYIPACYAHRLTQRDRELYDQHCAGVPREELAKRYKMTVRQVYRIIRRADAIERETRNLQLFPESP